MVNLNNANTQLDDKTILFKKAEMCLFLIHFPTSKMGQISNNIHMLISSIVFNLCRQKTFFPSTIMKEYIDL